MMRKTCSTGSLVAACLAAGLGGALIAHAGDRSIAEFGTGKDGGIDWRVVNDGVMGGLSQGKIEVDGEGVMTFSGTLSLENNGGFSSIRTGRVDLDLSDATGLRARVKGDGRTYQMRLGTDARYRGMEVSFMAEFATEKDRWLEVEVPFDRLVGSFRGMTLKDVAFDPAKVQRLGLLLGDKKAGPFSLQVDWIRAYAGESTGDTIVDRAVADGRFGTLATVLGKAGLVDTLKGSGPFTVFAPTDEAFAKLPKEVVEELLSPEGKERLQAILTYHVVPGSIGLADALKAAEATTVQGAPVKVAFADGRVRVGGAAILNADIECGNGVIHVIDTVLLPPAPEPASRRILQVAKEAGTFKTLLAAVDAAGLTEVLDSDGPLTVLAPTDDAFATLPKGTVENLLKAENRDQLKAILAYHAIAGKLSAGDALNAGSAATVNGQELQFAIKDGLLQVNGATIRTADLGCENGVIHVIDAVLIPKDQSAQADCSDTTVELAPVARIEAAIDRGVPVFNDGGHAECATIYRSCLEVLANDERVSPGTRKDLSRLLKHAEGIDSARDQAWVYRRALDHTYEVLIRSQG